MSSALCWRASPRSCHWVIVTSAETYCQTELGSCRNRNFGFTPLILVKGDHKGTENHGGLWRRKEATPWAAPAAWPRTCLTSLGSTITGFACAALS
jgi:hypothetical protein